MRIPHTFVAAVIPVAFLAGGIALRVGHDEPRLVKTAGTAVPLVDESTTSTTLVPVTSSTTDLAAKASSDRHAPAPQQIQAPGSTTTTTATRSVLPIADPTTTTTSTVPAPTTEPTAPPATPTSVELVRLSATIPTGEVWSSTFTPQKGTIKTLTWEVVSNDPDLPMRICATSATMTTTSCPISWEVRGSSGTVQWDPGIDSVLPTALRLAVPESSHYQSFTLTISESPTS